MYLLYDYCVLPVHYRLLQATTKNQKIVHIRGHCHLGGPLELYIGPCPGTSAHYASGKLLSTH